MLEYFLKLKITHFDKSLVNEHVSESYDFEGVVINQLLQSVNSESRRSRKIGEHLVGEESGVSERQKEPICQKRCSVTSGFGN